MKIWITTDEYGWDEASGEFVCASKTAQAALPAMKEFMKNRHYFGARSDDLVFKPANDGYDVGIWDDRSQRYFSTIFHIEEIEILS